MPFQRPPAVLAAVGNLAGFWASQPCRGETVSGDALFEETGRDDGQRLLLMVDVTGHGQSAAQTVILLEDHLLQDPQCQNRTPTDLLTTLHGLLQQEWAATGRLVAALALLLDGSTGTIRAGNAALPAPRVGQPGGSWLPWDCPGGPPLGLPVADLVYQDTPLTLAGGQYLLAFTDGVTEAGQQALRYQFQYGPLNGFLGSLPTGLPEDQLVASLLTALQNHVGAGWPEDDTTVLCVRRG